jgi:hypothetical protein
MALLKPINEATRRPVRRRPALLGSGPAARGRDVKRTLRGVRPSRPRAVVCSACPGRRRAGRLSDHRPADPRGCPGAGDPRRRQTSSCYGSPPRVAARRDRCVALTGRAAGCRLINISALDAVRSSAARRASCDPRQPPGVGMAAAGGRASGGHAPERRRVRPVSGRLEAVQKVCAGRQPGHLSCPG